MKSRPKCFSVAIFVSHLWSVVGDGIGQFSPLVCNGALMCGSMFGSYTSLSAVITLTSCAVQCNYFNLDFKTSTCIGFNYRPQNSTCDMFSTSPTTFTKNDQNCQYYQVYYLGVVLPINIQFYHIACQVSNKATCTNNRCVQRTEATRGPRIYIGLHILSVNSQVVIIKNL